MREIAAERIDFRQGGDSVARVNGPVPRGSARGAAPPWLVGAANMVVAALGFAIMNACVKEATRAVPVLETAFVRCLVGTIGVVLFARARGVSLRIYNRRIMFLRVVAGTVAIALTFYALSAAPLGEASALLNLTPLFVAAIGLFWLRERIGAAVGACLALGMIGAVLVYRPVHGGVGLGGLAAVAASATSALAMASLRRLGSTESAEAVVAAFSAFGAIVLGIASIPAFRLPDAHDAVFLVGAGVAATTAQIAMTRAYAADVAARVGGMNYLNIVASLFLAVTVFGERPPAIALFGIAAIVAAGVGLVVSAYRDARAG